MKLEFKKVMVTDEGEDGEEHETGQFLLLPRVTSVPEKLGTAVVYLSRTGVACPTPLAHLEAHDYHAPSFEADGSSPERSSAPQVTAESYVNGVRAQVEILLKGAN